MAKIFVEVTARHNPDGTTKPLSMKWSDGRVFEIDRVLDVRMAPSLKGGGHGIRYTCRIADKQVYLFDDGIWSYFKQKRAAQWLLRGTLELFFIYSHLY